MPHMYGLLRHMPEIPCRHFLKIHRSLDRQTDRDKETDTHREKQRQRETKRERLAQKIIFILLVFVKAEDEGQGLSTEWSLMQTFCSRFYQ